MTRLGPKQLAWVVTTYFTDGAHILRIGGLLIAWKPRKAVADPDQWNREPAAAVTPSAEWIARANWHGDNSKVTR